MAHQLKVERSKPCEHGAFFSHVFMSVGSFKLSGDPPWRPSGGLEIRRRGPLVARRSAEAPMQSSADPPKKQPEASSRQISIAKFMLQRSAADNCLQQISRAYNML